MATTYNTEDLIGGMYITQTGKFAADTYYRGMLLEYDSGNDRYQYLNTGDLAGIYLGEDSTVLTADDRDTMIA